MLNVAQGESLERIERRGRRLRQWLVVLLYRSQGLSQISPYMGSGFLYCFEDLLLALGLDLITGQRVTGSCVYGVQGDNVFTPQWGYIPRHQRLDSVSLVTRSSGERPMYLSVCCTLFSGKTLR